MSSLCIAEGGPWRRLFLDVPSKRTSGNNHRLQWEMDLGCNHLGNFFFVMLEQGLREALEIVFLETLESCLDKALSKPIC